MNVQNNLAAAQVPADTVCFHCQQVAEKYLKGFLAWHAIPFSKTHNLLELLQDCARISPHIAALRGSASRVNNYAVDTRYPNIPQSNPTLEQAREALAAALTIKDGVLAALGVVDPQSDS